MEPDDGEIIENWSRGEAGGVGVGGGGVGDKC